MLSARANQKHAPGEPIHWVKGKSADHEDCLARHLCDVGEIDPEMGLDYRVHVAWRGMAQLQAAIDEAGGIERFFLYLPPFCDPTDGGGV